MKLLHKIIFWSHLLAGVIAGIIIFVMSATGVILMYEHQLVEYAERDVRKVVPPAAADWGRLSLHQIMGNARAHNFNASPTGVILRNDPTASVAVGFGRNGAVYLNPYSGAILGKGSKLHDWFHDVIDWHRWLGMEGEGRAAGKAITGACNLAFFWLAVSGVYLWWPRSWHWRGLKPSLLFNPRLRGKARDWNWHNVIGFWSSAVLVVLTLTAAVMSYQWANDLVYTLTGSEPPPRAGRTSPVAQAQGRGAAEPSRPTPMASFDTFLARAEHQAPGWVIIMMRLPRGDGPVTVLIQEPTAPHIFARSQLVLDRSTAEIVRWEPYSAASLGRKLRIWVRGLHTGEALGFVGQTVAGLASLGGCFLVWTGLAMAWRRFRYRRREADEMPVEKSVTTAVGSNGAVIQPTSQVNQTSVELSRMDMEQTNSTEINEYYRHRHEQAYTGSSISQHNGDSILILYGTVTGTAESLAHKLAARLRRHGITAVVRDMADCGPSVLKQTTRVLMVISTYGDGEPPDDAASFYQAIVNGPGLDLRGLEFSVLALGNTTFDHFCRCGKELDHALERYGARRIYPRLDCDVDYDLPSKRWLNGILTTLGRTAGPALSA